MMNIDEAREAVMMDMVRKHLDSNPQIVNDITRATLEAVAPIITAEVIRAHSGDTTTG